MVVGRESDEQVKGPISLADLSSNFLVQRRRLGPSAATDFLAVYSAIRVFTSFRTNLAGKGLSA